MPPQSTTPSRLFLQNKKWNTDSPWQLSEYHTFLLFDTNLGPEWEIYHNPSLAQARPDFIIASKSHGAVIIEVKNWDFSGITVTKARDGSARINFSRGKGFRNEDPLSQLNRYRERLRERCYTGEGKYQIDPKTALIFLHKNNTADVVNNLLDKVRQINNNESNIFPEIICTDDIKNYKFDIEKIIPQKLSRPLDGKSWNLLNYSLGAIQNIEVPGYDWRFDDRQKDLINTRTDSGFRRIKGVAGSGKSVIIANRALKLAAEGKNVLIICYNITLVNLLHLMAIKAAKKNNKIQDLSNISFIHFHGWAKDMAYWTGNRDQYNKWSNGAIQNSKKELAEQSKVIQDWIKGTDLENNMYDAILVDEGQDFCLEWWDALRLTLKDDGEMVLVADENQDLYGRTDNWTEKKMQGSGFSGPWVSLKSAYRFPANYYNILASYCAEFLGAESIPEPPSQQKTLVDFVAEINIEWKEFSGKEKIDDPSNFTKVLHEVEQYIKDNSEYRSDGTVSESVLLVYQNKLGKNIISSLDSKLDIQHTFSKKSAEKLSFTHHRSRLKATTFHSFKGWEASNLIIIVGKCRTKSQLRGFYTALTRLKPSINNRKENILVLCGDERLTNWYHSI